MHAHTYICTSPTHECIHTCSHMYTHSYMHVSAHINKHVCLCVFVPCTHICVHQHIYIHIGIHTPCAQTLAFREAHRGPETKGGLRQLTLLLLVSAGTLRRRGREAGGWPLDPSPAGLRPRDTEVSGSSELPPPGKHRRHALYCQEALNRPPFGTILLRFTQFVNNKIKSHFNGKERVI